MTIITATKTMSKRTVEIPDHWIMGMTLNGRMSINDAILHWFDQDDKEAGWLRDAK